MSEQALWHNLRKKMKGRWHVQRHEDKFAVGLPDLSYTCQGVSGWIELKYLAAWPKRASTPVDIGLSKEQILWMNAYVQHGGNCFILLQVGREYFMYKWPIILEIGSRYGWINAAKFGTHNIDAESILEIITR